MGQKRCSHMEFKSHGKEEIIPHGVWQRRDAPTEFKRHGHEEMLPHGVLQPGPRRDGTTQSLRAMAHKRCSHMKFKSHGQEEMLPHRVKEETLSSFRAQPTTLLLSCLCWCPSFPENTCKIPQDSNTEYTMAAIFPDVKGFNTFGVCVRERGRDSRSPVQALTQPALVQGWEPRTCPPWEFPEHKVSLAL